VGAGCQPTSTGLPWVVMPHAHNTGSALAPGCIRKWEPSKNRYSSSTCARSRDFQASNSSLTSWQMRLTVDFDNAASGLSTSPSAASTSRTLRPRTTPR